MFLLFASATFFTANLKRVAKKKNSACGSEVLPINLQLRKETEKKMIKKCTW